MNDEECIVSSEIYEEHNYSSPSKPTFNANYVVSRFKFTHPQDGIETDPDGDLIVPRKKSKLNQICWIDIEHMKSTALDLVGLQVWRGAFLLADWLIFNGKKIPKGSYILELGSGVGLTSIVASMFAPVFCTDVDKGDILPLIKSNIDKNKFLTRHSIKVLELDFTSDKLPQEIVDNLHNIPIIIAADTVYDDALTEAFVKTVEQLLATTPHHHRSVYVALEKRYVFTIADCDSVAPCYEHYLRCLRTSAKIKCEEVHLDFPKYFEYDRVKELVLWKLTLSTKEDIVGSSGVR